MEDYRITTDKPTTNVDLMVNRIYMDEEKGPMLRCASEDGESDTTLRDVSQRACLMAGCACCAESRLDPDDPRITFDDLSEEEFRGLMEGCTMDGCPIAIMHEALTGATLTSSILKAYEDKAGLEEPFGEYMLRKNAERIEKDKAKASALTVLKGGKEDAEN